MAHSVLYFILTVAVVLVGCNRETSGDKQKGVDAIMKAVKSELAAGKSPERQEPFTVREFHPYINDQWIGNGVAYGCYRKGQEPGGKGPSDAELLEDLQIIAQYWHLIRVYGADDDTRRILEIIDKNDLPIRVIQGIWLAAEDDDPSHRDGNIEQVALAIDLAEKYPDLVIAVSVANETQVFWSAHQMNPDIVIRYIRAVRRHVDVPVTTADDYLYWNKPESRQLAEEIDFIFTHIHPLWNGKTLDSAITWLDDIYREVQTMHSDRKVVIGETGWATDYNREQTGPGQQGTLIKGDVGYDAQASFLTRMNRWVEDNQVTTILFEAFDEPWKGGGDDSPPNEVEKHWGVYNEDRTPKPSFIEFLNQRK